MMLADLLPTQKQVLMTLLQKAGMDVSHWAQFKGKHPSNNPKYCYNWSFEQPGEFVVACLWHRELEERHGKIFYHRKPGAYGSDRKGPGVNVTNARAAEFLNNLALAYRQQLPVKAVLVAGDSTKQFDPSKETGVKARMLDDVDWAVLSFDEATGECYIERGAKPLFAPVESPDEEASYFEGPLRRAFYMHRHREAKARRDKIRAVMNLNRGKLVCEVPECGFDFQKTYGEIGREYAQVHHLIPLSKSPKEGRSTKLSDLAIVCANCHAMIHRKGGCRPLAGLIA